MSWAGHPDIGWFEVGLASEPSLEEQRLKQIEGALKESEQYVAVDNTAVTKSERIAWTEYRRALREIYLQPGFPNEIFWPARPE